jgi:hypothetical protein
MKKIRVAYLFAIMIALFALVSQAYTAPFSGTDPKPQKTPGAQATENAIGQDDNPENTPEVNEQEDEDTQGAPGAKATEKAMEKGNKHKGKPEHFKGKIQSVDAGSISLDVSGTNVTIALTTETRIHIPGNTGATLQPGLTAMVKARRDENNNLIASSVQVIPGKPAQVHRVGIVTAYTAGASITIQAHDGNEYTFPIAGDIKILPPERADQLAVGALVTIIAPRQPGSTDLTAKGIVVHPAGSGSGAFGTSTPAP